MVEVGKTGSVNKVKQCSAHSYRLAKINPSHSPNRIIPDCTKFCVQKLRKTFQFMVLKPDRSDTVPVTT